MAHNPVPELSENSAQMAYARHADGQIIHVSQAMRGRACNCVCPACKNTVIARKGTVKVHHFAHAAATGCSTGPETGVHDFAKKLVAERRQIEVPPKVAKNDFESSEFGETRFVTFDSAVVEDRSHDALIPDVLMTLGRYRLAIEIAVTHRCPPDKIEKYRAHRLPALEIILTSLPRNAGPDLILAAVTSSAPRLWLYHPHIDRELVRLSEREIAREREKQKERNALLNMEEAYEASTERLNFDWLPVNATGLIRSTVLAKCLEEENGERSCFQGPPSRWQNELLNFLVERRADQDGLTITQMINALKHRGVIHPAFNFVSDENRRLMKTAFAGFVSPYDAIRDYMLTLRVRSVVEEIKEARPRRFRLTEAAARILDPKKLR
jgi:hypothetical protein